MNILGLFKCEVSLEGPSFASVQAEHYMLVVRKLNKIDPEFHKHQTQLMSFLSLFPFPLQTNTDLPSSDPVLTDKKQALQSNDKLNLNCTSAKSFPASKLMFFINDNPVHNFQYYYFYDKYFLIIMKIDELKCSSKRYDNFLPSTSLRSSQ